jgi:hypothetical protein
LQKLCFFSLQNPRNSKGKLGISNFFADAFKNKSLHFQNQDSMENKRAIDGSFVGFPE